MCNNIIKMPTTADCDCEFVSKEWLLAKLRSSVGKLVILDCRSSYEYGESHIRDAVNFSIPSIMLRRLAAGKIDLLSTIKSRELKNKISDAYKDNLFVLYNDLTEVQLNQNDSTLGVLLRRLTQDGCRVVCLEDGFSRFRATYPEWCDSCSELLLEPVGLPTAPIPNQDQLPLMGLRSLRISTNQTHGHRGHLSYDSLSSAANSSTDSSDTDDRCDSSLGLEDDREFPVEILPHLYLGNAANSEDSQALARHSIQYVLNVTPDLPNVFEKHGNIKYMQIPIADHWSQNLASHFPKAIEFIDEARSHNKGVLVHCLAGVSRSVTITVAYLMYKCSLNLNDAFNLVRSRKSNIAPNFHFMEQLHCFERELKLDVSSQSPTAIMDQINRVQQERLKQHHQQQQQQHQQQQQQQQQNTNRCMKKMCSQCNTSTGTTTTSITTQQNECKCHQQHQHQHQRTTTDFLSPLGHIGVSPDSGIEFDRWASSTPGTGPSTGTSGD